MARKKGRSRRAEPDRQRVAEPMLVHCVLRIPKKEAAELLPQLGIALDCGEAVLKRRRDVVEIEADVDVRTVADIVGRGVPVLVTERLRIAPIPRRELARDANAWLRRVRRLG
jgi:hypothetical protein